MYYNLVYDIFESTEESYPEIWEILQPSKIQIELERSQPVQPTDSLKSADQ